MKNNYPVKLIFVLILLVFWSCVRVEVIEESNIENDLPPEKYIPSNLISENEGLLGQQMFVKGQDFFLDSLSFYFDDFQAYGYLKSDDTLLVTIPRTLNEIESVFTIYTKSKDSLIYSSNFKLKKPAISHFSKSDVTFGETLCVYGKNFDNNRDYINVYLNDENISPSNVYLDSVKIQIPNNIDRRELSVRIEAQLQEDSKSNSLYLKEPVIKSFPSEVFVGTIAELIGENFNPDSIYTTIVLNDDIEVSIDYNYKNGKLNIVVPYGPYEDFNINSITYETAGMQVSKTINTKIGSNHILYSKNAPLNFPSEKVFEFNGNLYTFAPETDSKTSPPIEYLWKFDFYTKLWVKDEIIQIESYGVNMTQIYNGVFYVYRSGFEDRLFKIDLNNHSLEGVIDIPNENPRVSPVFFQSDGYLYVGKGRNPTAGEYLKDLFRLPLLNTGNSNWEEVSTDTKTFYGGRVMKHKEELYLSTNTIGSGIDYSLHKFNAINANFETVIDSYIFQSPHYIFVEDEMYIILTSSGNNVKQVHQINNFDFNNPKFTFNLDGLHNESYNQYFSFDNKVYFYGGVTNHVYSPSRGIYKLSDELCDQFK
ncbi:hypothetical protein [Algibacter sp. R77976]|uniref:hypothetical protein n=1 Tax=Algibacter sp. R77976 TaxID=3093873 RepID=UPI0037C939D3